MSAKELLEQATPLPWVNGTRNERGVIRSPEHGLVAQAGPFPRADADAALIVYAVNRLPDYEAAVDALARLAREVGYTDYGAYRPVAQARDDALKALRQLRGES